MNEKLNLFQSLWRFPKDTLRYSNRKFLSDVSILLGSLLLLILSSIVVISTLLFTIGFSLSPVYIVIAVFISLFFLWKETKKRFEQDIKKSRNIFIVIALSAILAGLLLSMLCGKLFDLSPDSQSSYEAAIYLLSKGWNPFHTILNIPRAPHVALVASTYSKGTWYFPAIMNMITNNIETGKSFNFLLMLSCFFISAAGLLSFPKIKTGTAFILGLLLSASPVSIAQSLAYYADGSILNILIILIFLGLLLSKNNNTFLLIVFTAALILGLNIKMIALLYVPIVCLAILTYYVFSKIKTLKLLISITIGFVLGIFLVGYSPYVTNTIEYNKPYYNPTLNFGKDDLKTSFSSSGKSIIPKSNKPANFYDENGFEKSGLSKLLISLFSRSHIMVEGNTEFKIPGTFSLEELKWLAHPDIRIGGFGPFFSAILILSTVIILLSVRTDLKNSLIAANAIFWIMFSVLLNPESWWARYAPQVFLFPFIAVILALCNAEKNMKFMSLLNSLLIVFLLLNAALISVTYYHYQYKVSWELKKQLTYLSDSSSERPVGINLIHYGNHVRLEQNGVRYKSVPKSKCEADRHLVHSETIICKGDSGINNEYTGTYPSL